MTALSKSDQCLTASSRSAEFGYLQTYKKAVKDGQYILGKWMTLNLEYVKKGLDAGEFFYDEQKATNAIRFIEKYLQFVEGIEGPFLLQIWQKYIIACIFGLVDEGGERHFTEFVFVCGRKQGKSAFAAAIEVCVAYTQTEIGMQLYNLAPKLQQANIIYDQALLMINKNKKLASLGKKRRSDYYISGKNCKIAPLAFNSKKSDGFNPYFCCFDEFAAWPGAKSLDMYNVMLSGQGSRLDPINLSCSTANFEDGGLYDELYGRSTAVLLGQSKEKILLPFLYMIDDLEKWDDIEELRKALPNLGVSFHVKKLKAEIEKAHESIQYRKEFITKYCNIKQTSTSAWLQDEDIKSTICEELKPERFRGCHAVGGVDLSQTTDLTAAVIVITLDGVDYILSHFWIPGGRLKERSEADNIDYQIMCSLGHVSLSGDKYIDYKDVTAWFVEMRKKYRIKIQWIGFDRYSSTYFVDEMQSKGFKMDDVNQGTNLTAMIDEFAGKIQDGNVRTGTNGVMQSHLRNASIQYTAGDNRVRLVKGPDRTKHIDGVAALLDALAVRSKYNDKLKWLLSNKGKGSEDDAEMDS